MRRMGLRWSIGLVTLAAAALIRPAAGAPDLGGPLSDLTAEEQGRFELGAATFSRVHGPEDGLGPLFNGRACAECHAHPAVGGTDRTKDHLIKRIGRESGSTYDDMPELGGPILGRRSVREITRSCSLEGEKLPKQTTGFSERQPPALYGLGLIAAIPDETLLQVADAQRGHTDGIAGRPNRLPEGLGRFGTKGQFATLERFIADAQRNEIGITNPLFPDEKPSQHPVPDGCDPRPDLEDDGAALAALVDFVLMLAPPGRGLIGPAEERGRAVFEQVGCVACHTPSLRTGSHAIVALSEREVELYSDLLIHDMGEYLADGIRQGEAGGTDWRTPPLWGLGQRVWYLHDARAADLRSALELHNGEAKASRDRLFKRPRGDLQDLLAFLRSL